jgi:alkylation response protein AidB-like acyl-CoA dehydrogenase
MAGNHFKRSARDTRFILFEQLGLQRLLGYEPYRDFSLEDFSRVIDQGLKVAEKALGPTLQDGDRQGCIRKNGGVITPDSFKPAWQALADGGWIGLGSSRELGGMGMPQAVKGLTEEFFLGANLALHLIAGLTTGNGRVIQTFGDKAYQERFCRNLYAGKWAGTMCLTEPEAGSDVGRLTTSAAPDPASRDERQYRISGLKRFITGGDQDLTENIIHLVLARIQGDPEGSKGVSLFIVPKIWVNPDGSLGETNDVACVGLEEKMGVHGSPTCALRFGASGKGSLGLLLGRPRMGLMQMFLLMNEARLYTGMMGMAMAASAYDTARFYAAQRVQGPPFFERGSEPVPILRHADVRRMLMNLKAGSEAMRALIAHTYMMVDVARYDPDAKTREHAERQAGLLTPLVKAYCSDMGYALTRDAIQVLGGNGYCRQFPAEQYARDAKILSVWEGTNYIQAQDLVRRKLALEEGLALNEVLDEVNSFIKTYEKDADFRQDIAILARALRTVSEYPRLFKELSETEQRRIIPLNATRFLENLAELVMGKLMLQQALIARERYAKVKPESPDGVFYRSKFLTARYYCRNIMPNIFSRYVALHEGDDTALIMEEEAFRI